MPTEKTALYRLFDNVDSLLYVGISQDPKVRWRQHVGVKPWASNVTMRVIEWYDSRSAALLAELKAIRAEHPRHNVQHARRRALSVPKIAFVDMPFAHADEEWITPTEAARRIVALGYAPTMTRQRIYQLADSDPAWPAARNTWRNVGNYKLIPWGPVREYFKDRDVRSGPKGWSRTDAGS